MNSMSTFQVNSKKVTVPENKKLITFLREDLNLTSVKNGCSEGACGTCMILVDGKPLKACVQQTDKLSGKQITTVEGLSEREKNVYAYAFCEAGAVQCGFCTPGMIISAKGLLDQNQDPTDQEIRSAIKNNICRCTGYQKIVEAIKLAAKLLRENQEAPKCIFSGIVGESMHRIDAKGKILGTAEYVDDLRIEGMVYGSAVRSPHPRAIVKSVDTSKAKEHLGVLAVLTAEDIPGQQKIGHIMQDWDVLIPVGKSTHCAGDAIVLIAAKTKEILEEAKALVKIEYDVLIPITNPIDAMKPDSPQIHEKGNVLSQEHLVRGDAESVIEQSKYFVTTHYSTPPTEHAFLETETAVALWEGEGRIRIYCGDQGIYQTQKECAAMLGIPAENVRVINKMVGGGFGGKEDMSVQHLAALLAYFVKCPVKVSLTRKESMLIHPKRHAMEMDFTTACDENGYLTAMKAVIIADTGAYASLGGPVLQRACTHAAGPYNYQVIDILGKAVYTNNPPAGAYRGFGVTQSCFATECNLNLLAEKVGISPWEIRYRNAIRPGQVLPNGQIADDSTAMVETLEAVKEIFEKNPKAGIACAIKNSGVGVGLSDVGRCRLDIEDGKIHIRSSAACIGQGLGTILTQIVCQITGVTLEKVIHEFPDTGLAPNSGNTTASRQTLFTGEATARASRELKAEIDSGKKLESLEGKKFYGEYDGITDKMGTDKENPTSHIAYGYATHMVLLNEEGVIEKVIAAHDVGKAVHPQNIEGQIEGGVVMSLGYALTENYPLIDGLPTAKYATLGLFKANQVPTIESMIIEKNPGDLALGAKGIGEICSIPTAPAVALAYYNYDGKFRTKLPLENTAYSKKK